MKTAKEREIDRRKTEPGKQRYTKRQTTRERESQARDRLLFSFFFERVVIFLTVTTKALDGMEGVATGDSGGSSIILESIWGAAGARSKRNASSNSSAYSSKWAENSL